MATAAFGACSINSTSSSRKNLKKLKNINLYLFDFMQEKFSINYVEIQDFMDQRSKPTFNKYIQKSFYSFEKEAIFFSSFF